MKISQDYRETLAFLATNPNLDLAIIFGSAASDRARPHSDIDIAVYPSHPLDHYAIQDLSDRIALTTGRPVDLVDLSRADGALLRQILRTGKLLFTRKPGILGTLHERLLVWQEDFEPALKAMLSTRLKRFTRPLHGS